MRIIQAASWLSAGIGPIIIRDFAALAEAAGILAGLTAGGAAQRYGSLVTRVFGAERVEEVEVRRVDRDWAPLKGRPARYSADFVGLGFGFVPNVELAELLGCELVHSELDAAYQVKVDHEGRTSVPGVYAAREVGRRLSGRGRARGVPG